MKFILSSILVATLIYSYSIDTVNEQVVNLSSFSGKKILLVNIATTGARSFQLQKLEYLYQTHKDSLVVIGFVSNSFGNEPKSNTAIKQVLAHQYGVTFPVAKLSAVTGNNMHPIYDWLADSSKNGVRSVKISADFQKVLLSRTGKIVGIYSSSVLPTDSLLVKSILKNYD